MDWSSIPPGLNTATVTVAGAGTNIGVKITAFNPTELTRETLQGFVEGDGFISIEAEHYTKKIDAVVNRWSKITDYGRTLSGMRAEAPVDAPAAVPGKGSPCLEYQMYLFSTGKVDVDAITAPTFNFVPGRGLRYAVSFDDENPQEITLVPANYSAESGNRDRGLIR